MASANPLGNVPPDQPRELVLAKWSDRFIAWLVDFILVGAVTWTLLTITSLPFAGPDRWFGGIDGAIRYGVTSLAFFAYWTYFESTRGQSLGKMAMHLKTVRLDGSRVDVGHAAIESFGKAFLLPLDVILGWIFTNDKRQRLFARAGETIVIKLSETTGTQNVQYGKD